MNSIAIHLGRQLQNPIRRPFLHRPIVADVDYVNLSEIVEMRVDKLRSQRGIIRAAALHQIRGRFGECGVSIFAQKILLDLHHCLGAGWRPLFLLRKFFIGVIKILQIVVGDHTQRFDCANIPLRHFLFLEFLHIGRENIWPHFFTFHGKTVMPGEMIQPKGFQRGMLRVDLRACEFFKPFNNFHLGCDAHIAHPHRGNIWRVPIERLGDKPRRICKICQQRVRCHFANILRDTEDDGNGTQGFCHAANTSRLLADQPVAQTEILVTAAGGHHADSQLCGYIRCACNRLALIHAQHHFERSTLCLDHALGKPADNVKPLLINIHQPEFCDGQRRYSFQKSVYQFGRVSGTAAYDCNFHI